MKTTRLLLCATMALLLSACASTQVELTGTTAQQTLCPPDGSRTLTQVYWMPLWRPDQKEPALRETAALQGLQDYVASSCLAGSPITRLEGAGEAPGSERLLSLAATQSPAAQRILLVVVQELGPKLSIGIPVLVRGGTEVVLQVRVLDVPGARALADARVHWENGGTFVIKGVKTLRDDMSAALKSVLEPAASH